MRVVSYNVHGLRRGAQVARVINELAPDLIAIQEPGRLPLRAARMAALCERTGLVPVLLGGAARTTALLVRPDLTAGVVDVVRLPRSVGTFRRPLLTGRGAGLIQVGDLRVVAVHLGLSAAERAHHLGLLSRWWEGHEKVLVLGDLNEKPGQQSWLTLTRTLTDLSAASGPTYPAVEPEHRIDAVLGVGVRAKRVWVPDSIDVREASDHRPVVVDLDLTAAG